MAEASEVRVRVSDQRVDEIMRRVAAAGAALNTAAGLIRKLLKERAAFRRVLEALTACPTCSDDPGDPSEEGCPTCLPLREALSELSALEDFGS